MAEAIGQEAFHNVAYFGGPVETVIQQVAGKYETPVRDEGPLSRDRPRLPQVKASDAMI